MCVCVCPKGWSTAQAGTRATPTRTQPDDATGRTDETPTGHAPPAAQRIAENWGTRRNTENTGCCSDVYMALQGSPGPDRRGDFRRARNRELTRPAVAQDVRERHHDTFVSLRPHKACAEEFGSEIRHHERFLFAGQTAMEQRIGSHVFHGEWLDIASSPSLSP